MNVKKQAVSGMIWTFSQQFSVQAINVLVGIILARILAPEVFGLIGMLAVFIAIGTSLTDSGMTSSLIRSNDNDQRDYSTVFYFNLLFSIVLYLILYFFAPLIADFYNQPILCDVTRVYTISFIIRAFVGVQTTILTKEMRFKEQMMMQIPSTIIGGIVGIVLAYNGYGVWSIVWMNLSQSFIFTVQHWIFAGWKPSFIIHKERLKYHLHFGYKLTLSGIIDTIYSNVYKIVIGKFFSASDLGYYSQAKNFQMLPVTNISTALNKVTYPLFASIKDDDNKLRRAYQKLLQQVMFWIAPLMILAIVIAKPLFVFMLTAKWLPAVPFFQLLCITGILYPFHTYNLNILNVKGRSDLFLKLEVIKKLFITIGICGAIFFGIYGLLIFQIISSIFSFWINTYYSGRFLSYPGKMQILEVSPILIIALVDGAFVWFLGLFLIKMYNNNLFLVVSLSIIYIAVYLLASKLFKIPAILEFKKLILKQ